MDQHMMYVEYDNNLVLCLLFMHMYVIGGNQFPRTSWNLDPNRPRTLPQLFEDFTDDLFLKMHRFTKEQVWYMLPRLRIETVIELEG